MSDSASHAQAQEWPNGAAQAATNGKAEDFDTFVDMARQTVSDAASTVREGAKSAQATAEDHLNAARAQGQQAVDRGRVQASLAQMEFEALVRKNPTAAVIGAVGLGLFIGMAFKRR